MPLAQFLEDLRGGPGAACLIVGVSPANSLYRFPVILLLPFQCVCQYLIERGGGILPVALRILFELRLTFRSDGYERPCPKGKDFRGDVNALLGSDDGAVSCLPAAAARVRGYSPAAEDRELHPHAVACAARSTDCRISHVDT